MKDQINRNPRVSIIVLNWNGWEDTIECLESLFETTYQNREIIVVDNYSTNGSVEKICKWADGSNKDIKYEIISEDDINSNSYHDKFDLINSLKDKNKFILIKNKSNYGFAKGNNIASYLVQNERQSKYVMLLNNDTVVKDDFLSKLVDVADNNKSVAIVGPKMYYYDFDGKKNVIWFGGGKINWKKYPGYHQIDQYKLDLDSGAVKAESPTDWVSGACIMINNTKVSPILNDDYFFGCEDIDLCLKTKKMGYGVAYVPSSLVWHKVSKSRPRTLLQKIKTDSTNFKFVRKNNRYWPILLPYYSFMLTINYFKKRLKNISL